MVEFTELHERALSKAHARLDDMSEVVVQLREQNKYQERRIEQQEIVMKKHMDKEEIEIARINMKLDGLNKYRWIALGVIVTVMFLSGDVGMEIIKHILGK